MVALILVAQTNGRTFYFDDPIPKVHLMKLLSCSFFNSWNSLKNEGSESLGDEKKDVSVSISKLPPGHYDLDTLAKKHNRSILSI